jgi:hypothetical protein
MQELSFKEQTEIIKIKYPEIEITELFTASLKINYQNKEFIINAYEKHIALFDNKGPHIRNFNTLIELIDYIITRLS